MLNKNFLSDVREALTINQKFSENNFLVKKIETQSNITLSIIYRFDPEFYFQASVPKSEDINYSIPTQFNPKTTANGELKRVTDLKISISSWTEQIYKELMVRFYN
ncbi:hypothetical protein DEAC_c35980 [Desulfosporosinus acididurans]|uniref:Uncharacterized protein n=1 Tax=Desulfosporosinus acididurans TaxID=476652 RepID=A0A0J1II75_9FIRM|nr:hypothetical protein [Desulfosporosinus acididurans]KLU64396.1 hypothetical protein DEAC_c35980 [Desulfosporosinus acididurans]